MPAEAVGVVLNVTAIQADGTRFVTTHPCLDADRQLCVFTSEATHLTLDVVGYIL